MVPQSFVEGSGALSLGKLIPGIFWIPALVGGLYPCENWSLLLVLFNDHFYIIFIAVFVLIHIINIILSISLVSEPLQSGQSRCVLPSGYPPALMLMCYLSLIRQALDCPAFALLAGMDCSKHRVALVSIYYRIPP